MWGQRFAIIMVLACLPSPALAQPKTLQCELRPIHDPLAGCNAMKLLVPAGWKIDGGIQWRLDRATIAHVELRCFEPGSLRQVEFLPLMPFQWNPEVVAFYPQGSVHLGMEMQPPATDVRTFMRDIVLPRHRKGARVISVHNLLDLAKTIGARETKLHGLEHRAKAASVRIEYQVDGKAVEEDIYCVLVECTHPLDPRSKIWRTERLFGVRSARGQLDADSKLLTSIALSPRLELEWMHVYGQVAQQWFRNEHLKILRGAALTRYLANLNRQISDESRKMWRDWSDSRSAAVDRFIAALNDIQRYHSPYSTYPLELPAGYHSAWMDAQGKILLSDQAGFNPNLTHKGTWTQLKKSDR